MSLLKEKRASLFAEWKSLCESVSLVERKILNYSDNIEDFFKNYAYHNNRLARVSEIISEYEEQAKSIERIFSEKNETRAVLLKQYQILSVDLTEKEKELSELFDDEIGLVEVAENIVASVGDYENTKRFINKYSAEKLNILSEIEEITEFLSKCDFKLSDGEDFKTEKKELSDELSVLIENLGKIKNRASDIEEKIKRRKEIEEKISLVDKEIVKFSRLMEVVKDRKFAEYVAAEYLSDVALDARKILLELSGGKYDVVYLDGLDGKDGFFIVDNLCGGVKRSIATLSGGETFLVSLSLALSLSSQVYSKSERPMEFFFLDEGFGTLDDGLVDVVLDSLSKLKNDRFTIGLISHLNELKSRIDCKIIVDGATEIKGSSVKIVC